MVDDDARRRAVERLEALIGEEEVRALMGSVPPFRWEELATKQDLREHFAAMDERFNSMDERFNSMEQRFNSMDERFSATDDWFSAMGDRFSAMDDRFSAMDDRFAAVNERLDVLQAVTQQTRTLLVAMIATIVAVGSLAVALTQLA